MWSQHVFFLTLVFVRNWRELQSRARRDRSDFQCRLKDWFIFYISLQFAHRLIYSRSYHLFYICFPRATHFHVRLYELLPLFFPVLLTVAHKDVGLIIGNHEDLYQIE